MATLPFSDAEYLARRARVREAMRARSIDVLYVTSPPNLLYLTGYEAIWYPPRLPVGVAILAGDETTTVFDWSRHEGYVRTGVLCDDAVFFEYGDAPEVVAAAFANRGWLDGTIALEGAALNPTADIVRAVEEALVARGATVTSGSWIVDNVRLYKSDAELERIRQAAAIADRALERLAGELRPGLSEAQVSARVHDLLAEEGSEIAASQPLVSAGPDAWRNTHAFPGRRPLERGDVVSIDVCGVVDRYHANLSRTYALGTPSALAREVLEQADGSLRVLCDAAVPDASPRPAAEAAEAYVRERIAPERIWWVGGYALGLGFPPSWVGHTYLHDDGPERCELRRGYVSNFENCLYDEREGWAAVTIETVVMTDAGLEPLSRLPRTLIEV
jgi:Xaa-Pro aminopeptidase